MSALTSPLHCGRTADGSLGFAFHHHHPIRLARLANVAFDCWPSSFFPLTALAALDAFLSPGAGLSHAAEHARRFCSC